MGAEIESKTSIEESDKAKETPADLSGSVNDRASKGSSNQSDIKIQFEEASSTIKTLKPESFDPLPRDNSSRKPESDLASKIEKALLVADKEGHKRIAISIKTLNDLDQNEDLSSKLKDWKSGIVAALAKSNNLKEVTLLATEAAADISREQLKDQFANSAEEIATFKRLLEQEASKARSAELLKGGGVVESIAVGSLKDKTAPSLKDLIELSASPRDLTRKQDYDAVPRETVMSIQNNLFASLESITPPAQEQEGLDPKDLQEEHKMRLAERQRRLLDELKKGEWGTETQSAFSDYLAKLKSTYPEIVRQLESYGLGMTKNNPVEMPLGLDGKRISEEQFLEELRSRQRGVDLSIDSSRVPSQGDYQKLALLEQWIKTSSDRIIQAENDRYDAHLADIIREQKLPLTWMYQEGQNKEDWRAGVTKMIEITLNVGRKINMVEAMKARASFLSKFPLEYPTGTIVSKGSDGRTNIKLDLPDLPDMLSDKAKRLLDWDKSSEKLVNSAVTQYEKASDQPVTAIAYGDMVVPKVRNRISGKEENAHAIFENVKDEKGNETQKLVGFGALSALKIKEGQTSQPFNLLEQRAWVEEKNGRIVVHQSAQAQMVPWYGYQNLTWQNVGGDAKLPPSEFGPDEIVVIKTGTSTSYMLAKDLKCFLAEQRLLHYGDKALMTAMDTVMLASGTVELAVAVRTARALAAGAAIAGDVTGRQLLGYAAKGTLDAGVGITGPVSNAYWTSSESGRFANGIRSGVFVATALPTAYGVIARESPALIRAALSKAGLMTASELAESEKAVSGIQRLIAMSGPALAETSKWSGRIMASTQLPMAPVIGEGLIAQVKDMTNGFDQETFQSIISDQKAGKANSELQIAAPSDARKAIKVSPETAESYKQLFLNGMLSSGASDKSVKGVEQVFESLKKALHPGATEFERQEIQTELIKVLTLSPSEIQELERLKSAALPRLDVGLVSIANDNMVNRKLAELAREMLSKRDQNVLLAAEMALLCLSSQAANKSNNPYFSATVLVPKQESIRGRSKLQIPEHSLNVVANIESIAGDFKSRINLLGKDERKLAAGEVLLKSGHYSVQEFGVMLNDVLTNPTATAAQKLATLGDLRGPRMGAVVINLILQEAASAEKIKQGVLKKSDVDASSFGRRPEDFLNSLRQTAMFDSSLEVRAAAGATIYGIEKVRLNAELGVQFLDRLANEINIAKNGKDQRRLSDTISELLLGELTKSAPGQVDLRIQAANTLKDIPGLIADDRKLAVEKTISNSLVQSLLYTEFPVAIRAVSALSRDQLNALCQRDKVLSEAVMHRSVQLFQEGLSNGLAKGQEPSLVQMAKQLARIAPYAQSETQKMMLAAQIDAARNVPQIFSNLRSELVLGLSQYPHISKEVSEYLVKTAKTDPVASVREAAILGLERIKSSEFQSVLSERLKEEKDIAVLGRLQELNQRNPESEAFKDTTVQLIDLQRGIYERYPALKTFDLGEQKKWLKENFPLLEIESFTNKLSEDSKDKWRNNFFDTVQAFGDEMGFKRQQEFKALCDLARADGSLESVQRARAILQSIIASHGELISGSSNEVYLGISHNGRSSTPIKYRQGKADWAALAATALVKTSTEGHNARDLSARLMAIALTDRTTGQVRRTLLDGWKELDPRKPGARLYPLQAYLYVLRTAINRDM